MIVRTGHITTRLSGLSPFDEFMRIQVSNMETLFKMESYFPGLRFTVIVDRYFFLWLSFFLNNKELEHVLITCAFLKAGINIHFLRSLKT